MPQFHAKTTHADQVWASPDGQRTIYEVVLEVNGAQVKAKTYSSAIGRVGFTGDLESYEKVGKMGPETYVKQVPKENAPYGGGGGFKGGSRAPADPFTMYLSYAKDIAVAMVDPKTHELDAEKYADVLATVLTGGEALFNGRPDAPKPETTPLPEEPHHEAVNDDPIDLKSLSDLFPE